MAICPRCKSESVYEDSLYKCYCGNCGNCGHMSDGDGFFIFGDDIHDNGDPPIIRAMTEDEIAEAEEFEENRHETEWSYTDYEKKHGPGRFC